MINSLFCIISIGFGLFGLLLLPKYKTKLIWLPFCFLLELGFDCIVLGALSVLHIGFSLVIVTLANFLLGIAAIAVSLNSNDKSQQTSFIHAMQERMLLTKLFSKGDLIAWSLIIGISLLCGYFQFGFPVAITSMTSDPATHYENSMLLAGGGIATYQYLVHTVVACVINICSFFVQPNDYYILYIYTETAMFILSGLMFYSLLSVACKNISVFTIVIISILYLLGYPLNNLIMGFSYLGASVTVVCGLLFASIALEKNIEFKLINDLAVSILLFEIAISYLLFTPPIYLGYFIFLICIHKKNNWSSVKFFQRMFRIFFIPVVAILIIVYPSFFGEGTNNTVASVIAKPGGSYIELYANFIFIAPLLLYGYYISWKKKTFIAITIIAFSIMVYWILLFGFLMLGDVSTYYFSKMYYIAWMLAFFFTAYGIQQLKEKSLSMLVCYSLVWLSIFACAVSGVDEKLNASRSVLNPTVISNQLFSVYNFNFHAFGANRISNSAIDQIQDIINAESSGEDIAIVTSYNNGRWYKALGAKNVIRADFAINKETGEPTSSEEIAKMALDHDYIYICNDAYDTSQGESPDETIGHIINNSSISTSCNDGILYKVERQN